MFAVVLVSAFLAYVQIIPEHKCLLYINIKLSDTSQEWYCGDMNINIKKYHENKRYLTSHELHHISIIE